MTYAASLSHGYVFEDNRSDGIAIYREPWPETILMPRSLSKLSHAMVGDRPQVARAVSLGVHLLNGLLVWVVARRLVTEWAAVFAVGLFWLLPIQTEAVASASYRAELIAATFLLLALWCAGRGWLLASFVCACATVMGKELGIVALGLVPLWAWRVRSWSLSTLIYWVVASCVAVAVGLAWAADHILPFVAFTDPSRALAALTSLLALMVWPFGLTIDHDWAALTPWMAGAAVVLWLGALETAWRHRWPLWGWALLWSLVAVSPRLFLVLDEGLHERHLYAATIAWSLVLGAALFPTETA